MAERPGRGPDGRARRGPSQPTPTTRRTTRVEPESQGAPARTTSRFTSRALILLLVVAVLGVSYASSIRAWLNQRSEQSSLAAQIAVTKAQIAQLEEGKSRWNDPAYIEAQARLRFGWVMPGERSYRVIGKDGKVLTAGSSQLASPLPASPAASPPWWEGAVQSLGQADSTAPVVKKKTQPVRQPATRIGLPGGPSGR